MARGVDGDGIIDPEDSVSNLVSRASCTSVLSEAQIEIQWQTETNRIMADLRLAKLAREEKRAWEEKQTQLAREERQAQLAREERQAQLAWEERLAQEERQAQLVREEKEAELKAELALKEAALKTEFLKKGLECRKSRSGSQVSSRRSAHTRTDFLIETHGGYLNTNSQQSKAVISGGGGEAAADVLLPKTAVRQNLTLQNFFDSNNLLGSNDRSLRGNVAFGAARSVPPDFENYVVSPGVPTGREETCPKNCSPPVSAVEYDGGVKNKYVSNALPAVTNARSCNVSSLNLNNGLSPAQSGSTQQDSFFQYQNCRTFIDKASLINYNGSNMPYIFFHNRIKALMDNCPFKN